MGRRRKDADDANASDNLNVTADSILQRAIMDVTRKKGDEDAPVGHERLFVLPVPSLAFRYLLQNEGLLLGRFYQFVGQEASFKSTLLAEVMRWHRTCGGFGILAEAEAKPTPELRNAILRWDVNAIKVEDCDSLEKWQQMMYWYRASLVKRFSAANGPGRTIPVCFGVDSLAGRMSIKTMEKIDKRGHAAAHFATEANLIKEFLQTFPQKLTKWPFTLVCINHLKPAVDENGRPKRNVPCGWAVKFHKSVEIDLSRVGRMEETKDYKQAYIAMQTFKNAYGADRIRIMVPLKLWYQNDAPAEETEPIWRLHAAFQWHTATVELLAEGLGLSQAAQPKFLSKIKEVLHIRDKSGGSRGKLYWCTRLGVSEQEACPAEELGALIENDLKLLEELYSVMCIQRRPFFEPGISYLKQHAEYANVVLQAEAAELAVKRAEALNERTGP